MPKRQYELPGVESPKNKQVEVRDKRMRLTAQEVEKRELLLDAMHKAKLTAYRFDDKVVLLGNAETVKVRAVKDEENDDDA